MQEEEYTELKDQPHLVILGAGATIAAIPNGDRNGIKCSAMDNFIETLGLSECFQGITLNTKSKNLEDIYSELYERADCLEIRQKLESEIRNYMSKLRLPVKPTIYDLLVLSLRGKDAIATFNWDPLLLEAYRRVRTITKDLPELLFLHGCVDAGFCKADNRYGYIKSQCPICKNKFEPMPLLYPIKEKNYTDDAFISHQWNSLKDYLEKAYIVTIFGYGSPPSDVEAIRLLKEGYGFSGKFLNEIEIIDLKKTRDELIESWSHFYDISNGHFRTLKYFNECNISAFPRRSTEGIYKIYMDGWWNDSSSPLKKNYGTFDDLTKHFREILKREEVGNYEID